ncbi:MAG: EAL domain-containing protein [Actinomycetia bacterium]|nr:EAL domain-containing protein [Actinomycetes bacterium]
MSHMTQGAMMTIRLRDDLDRDIEEAGEDAGRELAWIVVGMLVLVGVAMVFRVFDHLLALTGQLDGVDWNGVITMMLLLPMGLVAWAYRRFREARVAKAQLARLSRHDPLTGLPNRRFLTDRFPEYIDGARRAGARISIFFCDLDGFKGVNDTYGHEIGDELMRRVASRLSEFVGQDGHVIRYGGDEFVVVAPDVSTEDSAGRFAEMLINEVERPFRMGQDLVRISVSVGCALTDERSPRAEDVLRDADAAMYAAKANGAGTWEVHDRSASQLLTPATAERRLGEAVDNGEFRLYYQPIVNIGSHRVVAVETQLQWHHPERGIIQADQFVPALNETGLIVPVGRWLIEESARQAGEWRRQLPDGVAPTVMATVAPRLLAQSDFAEHVKTSVQESGARPDDLCLEVTETAMATDLATSWSMLRDLKQAGVAIALDRFGSDQSSLRSLRTLAIDAVRIDPDLAWGLGAEKDADVIVSHLVSLTRTLGIAAIIAGVDDSSRIDDLDGLSGCLGQGEHFADSMPPHHIAALITRQHEEEKAAAGLVEHLSVSPADPAPVAAAMIDLSDQPAPAPAGAAAPAAAAPVRSVVTAASPAFSPPPPPPPPPAPGRPILEPVLEDGADEVSAPVVLPRLRNTTPARVG